MKERGFQSGKRYIVSFLIGTVVFILVFALTYSLSYLEFRRVSDLQVDISYEIFKDKLDYSLFNEPICTNESFERVSRNLGFQGRIIDDLERKLGKQNEKVLFRKKFYTLIELEHFDFINLLNEKCDRNVQTILFFYSNEGSNTKDSEDAGKLLSVVHSKTENLMIYSFDINLDSDLIEKLKEKYDVERSPTMIINGEFRVENPQNLLDVEVYLS